jgi:hypothetical protein
VSGTDAFFSRFGFSRVYSIEDATVVYWSFAEPYPIPEIPPDRPPPGFHAAKRRNCSCGAGKWQIFESKLGGLERIEHVWNQLDGFYGSNHRFYR